VKLAQVAWNWERFGRQAPLEAILTELPTGAAVWETEAFFDTGRRDWSRIRARLRELGLPCSGARALDFGCGVGRLARHLLADFAQVDALDVSASMLRRGRELNPGERIRFLRNTGPALDLVQDGAYDLVLSHITLQHLPPPLAGRYVEQLLRKTRPGGALFFQLPAESLPHSARLLERRTLKQRLRALLPPTWLERYRYLRSGHARMDMFGLPPAEVEALLEAAGGRLVAADAHDDTGGALPSFRYFAGRPDLSPRPRAS